MKVVYNSTEITNIFGKFTFSQTNENVNFSCNFLVYGTSTADLVSKCATLETKLTEWNKDFAITFNNESEYPFSHSGNTGFLARPSLSVISNETQSSISRGYSFKFSAQLPYDDSSYNYRREAQISLSENVKGRKSLSISGLYTAGGVRTARDNYDYYGVSWSDSIASSLLAGGYELMSSNYSHEHENKLCRFSRSYQEKLVITITYNGYSLPNSYSHFSFSQTYTNFSFQCEFKILDSERDDAEPLLRIRNKNFSCSIDGTAIWSFSHSSNTGYLAEPNLRCISDKSDNDGYFVYSFSVNIQLPADESGYHYRQSGNISIARQPSNRKTISFNGVYTAGGSNTALQNYSSYAQTWINSWLSLVGGNYERMSESSRVEQENKICSFSQTYQEILYNDSISTLDETSIKNASISLSCNVRQEVGMMHDEATPQYTMLPIIECSASYSCVVDKEISSDFDGVYRVKVKPHIIASCIAIIKPSNYVGGGGTNTIVLIADRFSYNPNVYTISGSISFMIFYATTQVIELMERRMTHTDYGYTHQKIWDGEPNTYNIYCVGRRVTMKRVVSIVQTTAEPTAPTALVSPWFLLSESEEISKRKIGYGSTIMNGAVQANTAVVRYSKTFSQDYIYVEAQG